MSTNTTKRPSKPGVLLLWNQSADSASAPGMAISGKALERMRSALSAAGFTVADANADDDTDRIGYAVVVERPTFVFNLIDHFYGDNTQHPAVGGLLDLFGYQYTGSDPLCLSTCVDRSRVRLMLSNGDVPVPGFAVVRDVNAIPATDELTPPFIVSQALDDIYFETQARAELDTREELEERTRELAAEFDMPLLIEEYLAGTRISAVALGNRVLEVLPLCELYRDDSGADVAILAQLDVEVADRVRALTRRAFRVMGCRDVAQFDFVVNEDGDVLCTDVRPSLDVLPESAVFSVAADNTELGYDGALAAIARAAYERVPINERPQPAAPAEPARQALPPAPHAAGAEHEAPPAADADGDDADHEETETVTAEG